MDPETLLDYALLKLTPTRTRCDLVVFSGGKSEKLASGLVEPFISHLKYAKDQIPKGGYSITLRPPNPDASWFTLSTFQRLVRFISSPEILERFARLEREILQIENSVQSSELSAHAEEGSSSSADGITKKSTDSSKLKSENGEAGEITQEENSKIQLQRLLETRKALLRKEQAMAYARALVAGFEIDNLADLISFADNFGASRLREACIEFKELCKKKHTDGLWMDELAAMAAYSPSELAYSGTSGVLVTSESSGFSQNMALNFGALVSNGSSDASPDSIATQPNLEGNKDNTLPPSDQLPSTPAKVQLQMPWLNQIPQYMYNFQGPQGQVYPYHGMQPMPPFYPGHMHWPPNVEESSQGRHHKSSSKKKEKSPNTKESEASDDEELIESSDSDSRSDPDTVSRHEKSSSSSKKYRKKPSKTVVIRNINYITSKRKNGDSGDSSSDENEALDENSLKQKVDDVIVSLGKHQKSSKSHNSKKKSANSSSDHNLDFDLSPKKNENWDAFQNLLMKDEDSPRHEGRRQQSIDVQDEHFKIKSSDDGVSVARNHAIGLENESAPMQKKTANDSFIMTRRDGGSEGRVNSDNFAYGENFRPSLKGRDSADSQLLSSQRLEETGIYRDRSLSDLQPESSIIRHGKEADWFVVNHSGRPENQEQTIEKTSFDGNYVSSMEGNHFNSETRKEIVPIDDSFMVQTRASLAEQYDSQWRTPISMAEDLNIDSMAETGDVSEIKVGESGAYEPDDLFMVVSRDSVLESGRASWTPEMDYVGISFTKAEQKSAPVEMNDQIVDEKLFVKSKSTTGKKAANPGTTKSKVLRASYPSSKSDILSKTKRVPIASRPVVSKLEKEEEIRKRMEELAIQRQKRIAERTAATGATAVASKKVPLGSKTSTANSLKAQAVSGQINHKGGSNQFRK